MAHELIDLAMWLVFKGYIAAFLLGFITAFQIVILQNARTIRRNDDAIRRNAEMIRRLKETTGHAN